MAVQQPDTQPSIDHNEAQQNTGNHPRRASEKTPGGTGAAAETNRDSREESVETATDIDKVTGLDEVNTTTKRVDDPRERHPERDEHGRM
jgi:hypothetical protein